MARSRWAAAGLILLSALSLGSRAAPDPSDGIRVLFLVSDPYAANAGVWSTQLERRGYEVTFAALGETVSAFDPAGDPLPADVRVDEIPNLDGFDVLFLVSQPVDPASISTVARELRSSPRALDLVREAVARGLALYVGASAFGLLLDAGVVEGRQVLAHSALVDACRQAGGQCLPSRSTDLPLRDGQLVTGTSWFAFPVETIEAVARAIDEGQSASKQIASWHEDALELGVAAVDLEAAGAHGFAIGGPRADGAMSVCLTPSGLALAGVTFSGPGGSADAVVLKLAEDGAIVWARVIGGPGDDIAHAVSAAPDGGCFVAGTTTSKGAGVEDGLVCRVSPDGEVLWSKTLGGEGADMLFGICSADRGMAVCGATDITHTGELALWLVGLDFEGNVLWSTTVAQGKSARGLSVAGNESDGWAVAGWMTLGSGSSDGFLVRFAPDGTLLGKSQAGLATSNTFEDLVWSGDGWLAVGHSASSQYEAESVVVASFDAGGVKRWVRRYEQAGRFNFGLAVDVDSDGNVWVGGSGSAAHPAEADALVMRLDASGKLVTRVDLGPPDSVERIEAMCVAEGRLVLVGQTEAGPGPDSDVLVVFLDPVAAP